MEAAANGLNKNCAAATTASDRPNSKKTNDKLIELRLPAFWAKNPWAWFSQVEAQFHLRRITTQESRYYHMVSALPPEVADELDDVLALPPPENAYDHIKEIILARKTASEASRIQQLLTTEELGDRRPSQLLHRMRQLLGTGFGVMHITMRYFAMLYFDKLRGVAMGITSLGISIAGFVFPKVLLFLGDTYSFQSSLFILGAFSMNITPLAYLLEVPQWRKLTKLCESTALTHFCQDRGLTTTDAVWLTSCFGLTDIMGRMFIPLLADKGLLRRSTLLMLLHLFMATVMMAAPCATTYWSLAAIEALGAFLYGSGAVMYDVLAVEYFGLEKFPAMYGIIGVIKVPLQLCNPLILALGSTVAAQRHP
ncbi:hypothetical protein HPB47_001273 [Ixodes persulcatus]|uniref:Uncharacterized protein n=1 Tax=Ixodes persulcatus TaxID=34615 RepID=A0AC60PQN3_IXOPE|nr:hypothetical protein HPB47_001273 [Ixodes persulcatus]